MAWRIADWVLDGELDNTTLGWTTGWIQLRDRAEPLELKLAGNCHPDLSGWKLRIVRPEPIPSWIGPPKLKGLATDQSGTVGDITADQMVQHYECSVEEYVERTYDGDAPPTTLRKALYLEWFSRRNGRVVIQSTRLGVELLGERAFELSAEQWQELQQQNAEEMAFFMQQLDDGLSSGPASE